MARHSVSGWSGPAILAGRSVPQPMPIGHRL